MNNDLRFIGIGSAFNPFLGNTSAWFFREGTLFVIDCGETVFERLWCMQEVRMCEDIYVMITHLHNDHSGSLAAFASACLHELGKKIHIVHPKQTIVKLMSLMGISPAEYHYHTAMSDAAVSFEAVPVEHVDDMECYGYIIKTPQWTAYYSGDARTIPDKVLKSFYNGDIGCIYQDTSLEEAGHHAGLSYLEQAISPDMRKRVYCIHLEKDTQREILKKGFQIPNVEGVQI